MLRALCILTPFALSAQIGLTPGWDVQKSIDGLMAQARRMAAMVDEIKAASWIEKGAPEAYAEQAKSVKVEVQYLTRATSELVKNPDRMGVALDTYLHLQTIETLLESLSEGVRKYQNPALADLIEGMVAENENHRARLRDYLRELVANKEVELKVMNEEAQRCRGFLIRQPPPAPPVKKK